MATWIRFATLLGLAASYTPTLAAAEPEVDNLTWQNERGGQLEVSGSNFGSGPNVRLFDSFSNNTSGDTPLAVESPAWFDRGNFDIVEDESFSGAGSAIVADTSSSEAKMLEYVESGEDTPRSKRAFQEVYFSYAIKDLGNFPGPGATETSFPERSAAKDAWLMLGSQGNGGYRTDDPWVGNDIVVPTYVGGNFKVSGNSTDLGGWAWQSELHDNWDFQDWNQMFFHAKINPEKPFEDGSGFFAFANDNNYFTKRRNDTWMSDPDKKPYWDRIKFGPWYRLKDVDNVKRVHDSIYIATGPNANARVLLGDSKRLRQVTRLHHGIPVNGKWNDNKIVADFSHVEIQNRDEWYVFISNGDSQLPLTGQPLSQANLTDAGPEEESDDPSEPNTGAPEDEASEPDRTDKDESEEETPKPDGPDDGESAPDRSDEGTPDGAAPEPGPSDDRAATNGGAGSNKTASQESSGTDRSTANDTGEQSGNTGNGAASSAPPSRKSSVSNGSGRGASGGGGSGAKGRASSRASSSRSDPNPAQAQNTLGSTSSSAQALNRRAETNASTSETNGGTKPTPNAGNSGTSQGDNAERAPKQTAPANLAAFVGERAHVAMEDGRQLRGRIQSVEGDDVRLRISLQGGHATYNLSRREIDKAQIIR